MKKLLTAACIILVSMTACSDSSTKETTTGTDNAEMNQADSREKEIRDSTEMLDKKLADPNSTYSPDSLK